MRYLAFVVALLGASSAHARTYDLGDGLTLEASETEATVSRGDWKWDLQPGTDIPDMVLSVSARAGADGSVDVEFSMSCTGSARDHSTHAVLLAAAEAGRGQALYASAPDASRCTTCSP